MFQKLKAAVHQFIHATGNQIDDITSMDPVSRDEWKYIEGDRQLILVAERGLGDPQLLIYASSVKRWLPPHENEEITDADRERILKKVCFFFDKSGKTYKIE